MTKRFIAFLASLILVLGVAWGASYTVDPVGFLIDSDGRRVGFKRADGREDYFPTYNAAGTGLLKPDGTSFAVDAGAVTSANITDASANGRSLITAADYAAMRTLLTLGNVDNTSDATKNAAAVTLTNKTLTAPVISTISNTGTLTLPTSTDTLVGRATTDTLTNKTLTAPRVGTSMLDTNGNELFLLTATASAVNELTYANAATGNAPTFTASGNDSNISINLVPKGTGTLQYSGTEVGFRHIPQNSQSAAYTTVLGDCGKHIYHPSADTTARVFTIAANASVAAPTGCAITIVNDVSAGALTIAITSDTLLYAATGGTGSRTCSATCVVTLLKITSTKWIISGTGLS